MFKKIMLEGFWTTFHKKPALGSQTWNDTYFCYFGRRICENQLCVKTHSMFRVPDLFWLTGAMFRNMSVTHSKFSKRNESPKTGSFCRVRQYVNFSDTPAVSKRSFYVPVRYYIYIRVYIYINKYYIYIYCIHTCLGFSYNNSLLRSLVGPWGCHLWLVRYANKT